MALAADKGRRATKQEIVDALLAADALVVASHENPDGDALGSVRAMELALRALGKDVVPYIPRAVIPDEYRFIAPEGLIGTVPDDIEDRVLLALDCGNEQRLANVELVDRAKQRLNVDHHADNTHFGDLNVVEGLASCTAELARDLIHGLGVRITPAIATALHVGLVTDTGRFSYSNTTLEAFEMGAEMVRCGTDVHEIFKHVYESMEYHRLKLLGRALDKAERHAGGQIVATHLTRQDFVDAAADDDSAEGIVDMLRKVDGAVVAVFMRDLEPGGKAARKGSVRTVDDRIDVSVIARMYNGGGHRQAAGFSTDDELPQVIERVQQEIERQLAE